jgi:Family of unknown function (DUF5989)
MLNAPAKPTRGFVPRLRAHARTLWTMVAYFTHKERLFLAPLLLVVLAAGVLLLLTGGLSYIAPFVYALF